ncbi:MAG: hypothetical protein GY943_15415, partial [Chloroflexi bacterium]|nr:hypothetical protein [Chloroflexota bacterium]
VNFNSQRPFSKREYENVVRGAYSIGLNGPFTAHGSRPFTQHERVNR